MEKGRMGEEEWGTGIQPLGHSYPLPQLQHQMPCSQSDCFTFPHRLPWQFSQEAGLRRHLPLQPLPHREQRELVSRCGQGWGTLRW